MLAVHFGAGNIGRGFIGSILSNAGYDVCFIDVNAEIVNLLNHKQEYRVVLADQKSEESLVTRVSAINSKENPQKVIEAIAEADLVTTAVGPNILVFLADLLADGVRKRLAEKAKPLNIIACENMIGGSEFLKEEIYKKFSTEEQQLANESVAFPNAAVDRIVPIQTNKDKLMVTVEPYYEWVVDQSQMTGDVPTIEGVTFVESLGPYIERKLFTVNTGHAAVAYVGYQEGCRTIKDAMENASVLKIVKGTLKETGSLLVQKYGFNEAEHEQYITKILNRFMNPFINDDIPRVARGPVRKLGRNDRLISPADQYYQHNNTEPIYLVKVIAAALQYDFSEDQEAVSLQEKLKASGIEAVLTDICGLNSDNPLFDLIRKQF
ncbi:mannitol-1-phosphate 5-dehydrogenase [Bacillus alkalicellulosilyticus]|uniref:mannitol-1-phosphate 5-dehydrogenase n=1 Tax=Alkalihalobacterium alkalicellulosilyticum TaxID=1912214 RepID=UPI000998E24E|nr:mannitol-1-phosphate 5-dehydrogenase [Bacillus alkalicellulosilyticus]